MGTVRIGTLGFGIPLGFLLSVIPAFAHVSERALVLMLPTDVYSVFGVAAVIATVFLTVLVPPAAIKALFRFGQNEPPKVGARPSILRAATSILALFCMVGLIATGLFGPRDPLGNLLPLVVFTAWWICFPFLQALFGDLWAWVNPWSRSIVLVFRGRHLFRLPDWLGIWPANLTYLLAGVYTLTDIAPDDPARLAWVLGIYWSITFVMCGVFGPAWLHRGEGFTVFFDLIAKMTPFRRKPVRLEFPGQAVIQTKNQQISVAVFSVSLLALGSFDGLNETFWWMAQIGINPLEFPGRSAVVWPNRVGMIAAVVLLNLAFAFCVWIGLALVGQAGQFRQLYCRFALTLIPIALGYHFAHYLTSAMVNFQYLAKELNDPFDTGAALLGLKDFYVTTSFFNQHHTVQRIWLTQAGAIVLAHMLAVVLSHALALKVFGTHRLAVISQLPVAGFMVLYTLFGLWLLASPVAL